MTRTRIATHLLCGLLAAVSLFPRPAQAVAILAHAEHYDPLSDSYQFSLTFDEVPDFFTVDELDRVKTGFLWEIVFDSVAPVDRDVLVWGEEIRSTGGVVVRDARPLGTGGPGSRGWGPMRGIVSYEMAGNQITFVVPHAMLGDADGVFFYRLGVFEFGAQTDGRMGIGGVLPTPTRPTSWGRLKAMYR